MRLTHEILLHLSQDTAQEQSHFLRKESISRITIDSYQKHHGGVFTVPDGTQLDLAIGDVDAPKGMYLETDVDCDVYLNGSATPIALRKAPAPASGSTAAPAYAKLFLECAITSIQVDASQGADVTGTYVVWGDVAS